MHVCALLNNVNIFVVLHLGSDRYRGFLESNGEDIGIFDSDDSEDEDDSEDSDLDETDCSSITSSMGTAGARTPSVGTPSPVEEKQLQIPAEGIQTMTRPSIKYTNVWSGKLWCG